MTPCDNSLPGCICKEYRYHENDYLGYIQYAYNSEKQLVQQDLYSTRNNAVRYRFTYSSSGKIVQKLVTNTNGAEIERFDYQYNSQDSLLNITQYKDEKQVCITSYEYGSDHNLLTKKSEYSDGTGTHVLYQYDGNLIYKETVFNLKNELLEYSIYTHYDNLFKRVTHYNALSLISSYEIHQHAPFNKLQQILHYSPENKLLYKEVWSYTDNLLSRYGQYSSDNSLTQYNLYQY